VSVLSLLFGRRLANDEEAGRKIGWFEAVPAMGLDGLGSSSYGPEAALTVLAPLGAAGLALIGPLMGVIVALLAILYLSYRQTVKAYPVNGGAYTVAKENLGENAGLLAATALMLDYGLNVAVGISAGVGALTSSVPALQPYTLVLCLGVLVLVTVANLRGTGEAGLLFSLPTYLFLACFLGLIAVGLWRTLAGHGHPHAVVAPPHLAQAGQAAAGWWLVLRAFAAGCTAMTGVEAVSNGVGAFKPPVVPQARRTLSIIVGALALLLLGLAALTQVYHVGAMDQTKAGYQSVASQIAAAVAGRGPVYYVSMASLLAVLSLSANTSFVGFPRLCRMVAQDGFLPRPFATPDRRLVFSVGVLFLTVVAGALLVGFGGVTDRLIPLFAVGAFLTFTLSQAGMVEHWRKQEGRHVLPLTINALGAVATGAALAVIVVAKFAEGAWLTVLAIPLTLLLLKRVRRYYTGLDARMALTTPLSIEETEPPTVLVAYEAYNRMTARALRYALTLSPDVVAVHLTHLAGPEAEEHERELRATFDADVAQPAHAAGQKSPELKLIPAPYRTMHTPLLDYIRQLDADTPGRSVTVLIPERIEVGWWKALMHNNRAQRLRNLLVRDGDARLVVSIAPWKLEA